MITNFLKKNKNNSNKEENDDLIKIVSLLIHAAKIDEHYSDIEKKNNI